MIKYAHTLLLLTFLFPASINAKVILWDLGGVLFQPHEFGVAEEIGFSYFASYTLLDWKSPNIKRFLFDILEQMEKPEHGIREKAGTGEGVPLPTIMCHWQAGTKTGPEVIKQAQAHLKKLRGIDYFESDREYTVVKRTIEAMFNPALLARNIYPVKKGFALLKECVNARNKQGLKKHRNFVFSNWDHLSFDIFYDQNKKLFKDFEEIVISGHIKMIKPRAEAYKYLLSKYNLDPRECILIDDQEINAVGAQKCGIKTVLIQNGNYEAVRRELQMLEIL